MSPLTRAQIEKTIIETLKPFGVLKISLFGSFARGDLNPEDIDVLVQLPDPHLRKKSIGLAWFGLDQELSEKIGMKVDLVSEDALSPVLRKSIERDRRAVYAT